MSKTTENNDWMSTVMLLGPVAIGHLHRMAVLIFQKKRAFNTNKLLFYLTTLLPFMRCLPLHNGGSPPHPRIIWLLSLLALCLLCTPRKSEAIMTAYQTRGMPSTVHHVKDRALSAQKTLWQGSAEVGFWFYHTPAAPLTHPSKQHPLCNHPTSWTVNCGFIPPSTLHLSGQSAYAFEQKQYHALLKDFVLNPQQLTAVWRWTQFNHWVLQQAIHAAYTQHFVMVQHPEIDDSMGIAFSYFGRMLLKQAENNSNVRLFHALSKSGLLVFFSRSTCPYCRLQAPIVRHLARHTGIPLWNASLDKHALPGFTHTLLPPQTIAPAQRLHVNTVPALYLYLSAAHQHNPGVWIRLSTGLVDYHSIETRLLQFARAYRQSVISGMASGMQSSQQENTRKPS